MKDAAMSTEAATFNNTPISLIVAKLNAGRRSVLSPTELDYLLKTYDPKAWTIRRVHLRGLIEELPIEQIHDLVLDGWTEFDILAQIAHELDCEGETVDWIREMAKQ